MNIILHCIPVDGVICIDDVSFNGLDLRFIPDNIHAFHWNQTFGEIEFTGDEDNETVINFNEYQFFQQVVDMFNEKQESYDQDMRDENSRNAAESAAEEERDRIHNLKQQAIVNSMNNYADKVRENINNIDPIISVENTLREIGLI